MATINKNQLKQKKTKLLQPELNAQEAKNQELRRQSGEVEQTQQQKDAREQGVPLEAFRNDGESKKSFEQRVQRQPVLQPNLTLSATDIQAEQAQRQQFEQSQTQTSNVASQLEAGGSIADVTPEAVANAQATPGIGTARTPQEMLNPNNTVGGAIRATLLTIPTILGVLGTGALGSVGNLAGGALSAVSIGKFFNAFTTGKQNEVISDIASQVQGAKAIVSLAHEDPAQAEKAINQLESNIINNYGKLHVLYTQDPFASVSKKDVEEDMATSLRQIQKYRQKVEQYRRTGDPTFLIVETGFNNGMV